MIIAVIPAQSKSSRLPGKNMKMLLGKPLIDYTIEYARACPLVDAIYISTDSREIAEHAKAMGVRAIIRPPELCGDIAITEVLKHALHGLPDNEKVTHVVALQVDHPDRTVDLTELLTLTIGKDVADTVTIDANGTRNGSIRILRKKDLMENRISYSIMAVRDECTNIHYQKDFDRAAENVKKRLKKNGQ